MLTLWDVSDIQEAWLELNGKKPVKPAAKQSSMDELRSTMAKFGYHLPPKKLPKIYEA